jgi:hypothetical protein
MSLRSGCEAVGNGVPRGWPAVRGIEVGNWRRDAAGTRRRDARGTREAIGFNDVR